jgi:hypothetical protein
MTHNSADILAFGSGVIGLGPVAYRQVVLACTATSLAPSDLSVSRLPRDFVPSFGVGID